MLRKFIVCSVIVWSILRPTHAVSEEPTEAFLAALQERGYTEVALGYVEHMSTSRLASPSFKRQADYLRGRLLVDAARSSKNALLRTSYLDRAQQAFAHFLEAEPESEQVPLARSQLGNILVERARGLMSEADADDANQIRLTQQAAQLYDEALVALTKSRTEIGDQYKSLVGQRTADSRAMLNEVKAHYVQTYLAIARVLFEQAETVKDDAEQYKSKLTEAATAFEEVVQKYRSYSAGAYALLYEGECYQRMDEHARALTYFKELLQNADNSTPVRRLKTLALARSITSWLETDRETGHDRSISLGAQWIKGKRGNEDQDPSWLELRLALAKAYKQKASMESKKLHARRALSEARKLAGELARKRSPIQKEAQELLASLGNGEAPDPNTAAPTAAKTFDEAYETAKSVLDRIKTASATVSIYKSQLTNIRDPSRRQDVETKLAEAQQLVDETSNQAVMSLEHAIQLATEDDFDELLGARYYLAFLYYSQEQYHRAAVLAGFVALRYPDSLAAKECANVALASRQRLYQLASPGNRKLHSVQIARIAELMVSKWPDQSQSSTALLTLLDISLQRGDYSKAEQLLSRIPQDSAKYVRAELRLGQAIWRDYLQQATESKNVASLESLKIRAQETLARSIGRLDAAAPNELLIRAALSLAQINVESGESIAALDLLRHKSFGPLTLAEASSPWLERIPGLAAEAYKTAIRAYVASAAVSGNTAAAIDEAQRILDRLRTELGRSQDGQKRIMSIYVGLARDLQRQLSVATSSDRKALSKGFEAFLRGAAEGSKDITVLNWVAETFYGLGNELLEGKQSSPEAQRYFGEASRVFQQVLSLATSQPQALSDDALTQAKVRQAMSLRQLGQYQAAMDLFADVLQQRNKVLNIQIEAAKTLQQWGQAGNAQGYAKAIQGDRPVNGKNSIWGWGRIARLVANKPDYRDTFHDARYNIAFSRYRYALASSGERKNELLMRAKNDIMLTRKLANLGSAQQQRRYELLLKEIQKSLGEPPTGLVEPS